MTVGGENPQKMEEEDEKPRTLLIGNIPRSTHKRDIEEIFGEIGPLKRVYIQYPRDDKKKRPGDQSNTSLLCYVTFALAEDAVKALETLGSHKISGNKIHIKFAKTRSEQVRPKAVYEPRDDKGDEQDDSNADKEKSPGNKRKRGDDSEDGSGKKYKNPNLIPLPGGEGNSERPQKPKGPRPKPINKKSRLIIRNLSFKVTEEKMKEYFGACGDIKDVNILKKPDGKLVGCAFVQFDTVAQAAKAVRELNLKPFLGRPIAIDWALPKKDFQDKDDKTATDEGTEIPDIKIEDDEEDIKVKPDPDSGMEEDGDDDDVKFVNPYDSMGVDIKIEEGDKKHNRKRKIKDENESDSDEDDDDENEDSDIEKDKKKSTFTKIQKKSNDVEEGKTLFLRNLDFGVTEDDLKQFFEAYGPIHYALLCKDSLTEHPKGTGFVKFKDLTHANKCLTDFNIESTKFTLGNRFFNIAVALARERLTSNDAGDKEKKDKVKQDNRNLYLVREGFIRPGSSAAEGVSISDMNKRAALNSTKKQLLKNLSIFVSPNRLCVHNLPLKLTDKALRRLFKKFSSTESRITEARIMRDMKDIQLGGKGMSKGYGFVTYKEHDDALAALRTINNNPEIFSPSQRPIVEFSLENRKALQAKEKRMQKSVENNKMAPKKSPKPKNKPHLSSDASDQTPIEGDEISKTTTAPRRPGRTLAKNKIVAKPGGPHPVRKRDGKEQRQYSGLTGKVGVSKLPVMKAKGNTGGKITRKSLKGSRSQKKKFEERRNREPQIKPKKRTDKADERSENLLSKHKTNLERAAGGGAKKAKWYK